MHGSVMDVRCTDPMINDALGGRLRHFRTDESGSGTGPADIVFDVRVGAGDEFAAQPAGSGRPVYDAPVAQFLYYDDTDELFVDYAGLVRLRAQARGARIEVAVAETDEARMLFSHPLFTVAFLESIKRLGHFPLHAGCVERNGRGVVIPGGSGSGKTTLSVALARGGFGFLSDDLVFVVEGDDGLIVQGFADEVDLLDDTVLMFPELHQFSGRPKRPGRGKHAVRLEDVFGADPVSTCVPAVLLMPQRADADDTVIEPISGSEAMFELVPNVLLTDPAFSQAHLNVLGALANGMQCYRVHTGRDLARAVAVIDDVVASA